MNAMVGERHPRAKLSSRQVAMIRHEARIGTPYRRIAVSFGIAVSHVCRIVRFRQRNDINGVRCSFAITP